MSNVPLSQKNVKAVILTMCLYTVCLRLCQSRVCQIFINVKVINFQTSPSFQIDVNSLRKKKLPPFTTRWLPASVIYSLSEEAHWEPLCTNCSLF